MTIHQVARALRTIISTGAKAPTPSIADASASV
jgi:hypothetical protein